MKIVFFCASFLLTLLLILLFFPFKVTVKFFANALSGSGYLSAGALKSNLFSAKIFVREGGIHIVDHKSRLISRPISPELQKALVSLAIKHIISAKAEMYLTGGLKSDAYLSSVALGYVLSIHKALAPVLKSKRIETRLYLAPKYYQDELKLCGQIGIKINVYRILRLLVKANKLSKQLATA